MRLIGILICFIFSYAQAQNLIPNSSFEDENVCELAIPCSPAGWYSVTNIPYGYENNFTHHLQGRRAISFLVALKQDARTYWQATLLSDIKKGRKYSLHFYLYSSVKKFDPKYFGIYLSNTFFRSRKDTILQKTSWLQIGDTSIHQLKNQWIEISLDFEAAEDAKYMLMGNLSASSNNDILKGYSKKTEVVEYFVDDISLTTGQQISADEQSIIKKRSDSLYLSNFRHKFMKDAALASTPESIKLHVVKTDTLLLGRINFHFDSYELLNKQMIQNYFDAININTISKIAITGYTDSVGKNTYNLRLSENRAISVKNFLADNLRIPANKVTIEGKGKTNDQKLQEDNRRVELIIYRKE